MANEGSFRSENNKLKDFIKKQTVQIKSNIVLNRRIKE